MHMQRRRATNPVIHPDRESVIRVVLNEDLAAFGTASGNIHYLSGSTWTEDTGNTETIRESLGNSYSSGDALLAADVSGDWCV